MVEIKKIENNITLVVLTYFLIALVGYLDYLTGVELSFSFFYIIPISFLALNKRVTKIPIIIGGPYLHLCYGFLQIIQQEGTQVYFIQFGILE